MKRLSATVCLLVAGCSSDGDVGEGPDGGPSEVPPDGQDVLALTLSPGDTELVARSDEAAEQDYVAEAELADGTLVDVSEGAQFSVEDQAIGEFEASRFVASGAAGGKTTVTARYGGAQAEADLVVRVERTSVDDSAPPEAPDLFDDADEDAERAPAIEYPSHLTMFPPNIGDFEIHWTDGAASDLFEVRLSGEFADLRVYVSGDASSETFAALAPDDWAVAGESERGGDLELTVRGLDTADPTTAGTSDPITALLADEDVEGGVYYWASSGERPEGIYRHDMAAPGEPAEPFYTREEAGDCVACHALSRDGEKMAVTYEGGDGPASILDVATATPTTPEGDDEPAWNFATFDPEGDYLVTVHGGEMVLRDAGDGSIVEDVPTDGYATHPDFSPSGDAVVYVKPSSASQDWIFSGGSVVVQSIDLDDYSFGEVITLVDADQGHNFYYPSFSPDGEWVVFNRSTGNSYDDASAEVYIVPSDGSEQPERLDSPNVESGLTNSWARWAPFSQTLDAGEGEEPHFWLTFSSKRSFGVRLDGGAPQIWMAPFFPERALAGDDPSAPAFRLPFQDIGTHNHIAQWTEKIVVPPIE